MRYRKKSSLATESLGRTCMQVAFYLDPSLDSFPAFSIHFLASGGSIPHFINTNSCSTQHASSSKNQLVSMQSSVNTYLKGEQMHPLRL